MCLLGGVAARADRDIVYAARYYAPAGSRWNSHFHVYRINPDGTGKTQLTFGTADDDDPRWSSHGRKIRFTESVGPMKPDRLCEMDADGRRRHVLKTLTSKDRWPPDSSVTGYRLDDVDSGSSEVPDKHVLVNLKTARRLTLKVPYYADDGQGGNLLPMPGRSLVYEAEDHLGAFKKDSLFYLLNPTTGALRRLGDGYAIVWSPDGSRFCLVPEITVTSYERRHPPYRVWKGATAEDRSDAEYVKVFSAPLYVRATAGGPMRQITPRLSVVSAADWRKVK